MCIILIEIIENAIEVSVLLEKELSHLPIFMIKHKVTEKRTDDEVCLLFKGYMFFLHLTQLLHSHLKTTTQWEGERCNFSV